MKRNWYHIEKGVTLNIEQTRAIVDFNDGTDGSIEGTVNAILGKTWMLDNAEWAWCCNSNLVPDDVEFIGTSPTEEEAMRELSTRLLDKE